MKSLFTKLSKTLKKSNKRLNIDSGRSVSVEKDAVEKDMEWAIQRVTMVIQNSYFFNIFH